jgi:hypothetical protein
MASSNSAGKTLIDEKYEKYRQCQTDIQQLFLSKQQYLSQFNENTLVKGVSSRSLSFTTSVTTSVGAGSLERE